MSTHFVFVFPAEQRSGACLQTYDLTASMGGRQDSQPSYLALGGPLECGSVYLDPLISTCTPLPPSGTSIFASWRG